MLSGSRADVIRVYGRQPRHWMPAYAGIQEPYRQLQAALGWSASVEQVSPQAVGMPMTSRESRMVGNTRLASSRTPSCQTDG